MTFQHVRKTRYARFAHSCILQKKDFLLHYKSLVFFLLGGCSIILRDYLRCASRVKYAVWNLR